MARILQADAFDEVDGAAHAVGVRNQRTSQQDAVLLGEWVCAIADGLGGHANGAEASKLALETLGRIVTGPRDERQLSMDVETAHLAVCDLAFRVLHNPGTTLVVVVVEPGYGGVLVGWCGDSRAWLLEGDAVDLCTWDHSYPFGGLARCLGMHGHEVSAEIDIVRVGAGEQTRLLLTTDGVHGGLGERAEALFPGLLAAGLGHLVRVGAEHGTDNATAVLLDVDAFLARARDLGESASS